MARAVDEACRDPKNAGGLAADRAGDLYSLGALLVWLVTGRTDAERAAAGDYGGRELIGYLSADLVGAAGRAVGLDTLRVEQGNPEVRFDARSGLIAFLLL